MKTSPDLPKAHPSNAALAKVSTFCRLPPAALEQIVFLSNVLSTQEIRLNQIEYSQQTRLGPGRSGQRFPIRIPSMFPRSKRGELTPFCEPLNSQALCRAVPASPVPPQPLPPSAARPLQVLGC